MKEVITDWATELSAKLGRPAQTIIETGLSADDFSPAKSVEIRDPGGMTTRVGFAFAVIRPEQDLAAVFSEHCGYIEFELAIDAVVAEIYEEIYTHWGDEDDGDEV